MDQNLQIIIKELPRGALETAHFVARQGEMPSVGEGEVLLRTVLLSLDAANRAWMQGPTYREAVKAGDVMHGYSVCEVMESKAEGMKPGTLVFAESGWQQYCVQPARKVLRCPDIKPLTRLHSTVGVAGKTAYHGLMIVAGIKKGETLLVSAAAGSVGSIVGQLGKLHGARVIGVAGSADKCRWVVDELGFDACIDYKHEDVPERLKALCPEGVDVYFDNTGGPILQAALFAMKPHGRIACCGAISSYDTNEPSPGPVGVPGLIVMKRLRMEGFIVMDLGKRTPEVERQLAAWTQEGKLKAVEDVLEGLESAPAGLVGLLAGENRGKRMVRVGPDPDGSAHG